MAGTAKVPGVYLIGHECAHSPAGSHFRPEADRTAAIAPGKDADLLLLTGNPLENIANIKSIDAVISRGKAYPAAALQNLLRAVRNK